MSYSTAQMRLLVDAAIVPEVQRLDDAEFADFEKTVAFAEAALGLSLPNATELDFFVARGRAALRVCFCKKRERCVIVGLHWFEDMDGGDQPAVALAVSRFADALAAGRTAGPGRTGQRYISGVSVLDPGGVIQFGRPDQWLKWVANDSSAIYGPRVEDDASARNSHTDSVQPDFPAPTSTDP